MSDAGSDEELDRIRERKLAELAERADSTTPDEPIHVESTSEFEDLIADERVVLVDFYADWCGPCRTLEPTVEAVAAETDATVVKVDVDAHQSLAGRYGVRGVPTIYLFVDGEPAERLVGVQDEATLVELVENA